MTDLPICQTLDELARATAADAFDDVFAEHVTSCPTCSQESHAFPELDALLPSLNDGVTAPPELLAGVLATVRRRGMDRAPVRRIRAPQWARIGAVVMALLIVAGAAWTLRGTFQAAGSEFVAEGPEQSVPALPAPEPVAPPTPEVDLAGAGMQANSQASQAIAAGPRSAPVIRPPRIRAPAPRRAVPAPSQTSEETRRPDIAEATPDSSAIAAEQVYLALAIVGRTQARAESTLIEEVQRVESAVRNASPF